MAILFLFFAPLHPRTSRRYTNYFTYLLTYLLLTDAINRTSFILTGNAERVTRCELRRRLVERVRRGALDYQILVDVVVTDDE